MAGVGGHLAPGGFRRAGGRVARRRQGHRLLPPHLARRVGGQRANQAAALEGLAMPRQIEDFCGVSTLAALAPEKWNKQRLTYWVKGSLPNVSSGTFESTARDSFAAWSAVVPLDFRAAKSGETPDIVIDARRIDGRFGVLAESQLPNGSDRQLMQWYDTSESFVVSATPGGNEIDLLAVMIHEIGHVLGLDHAPRNSPDIMAPTYKVGLRSLQPGDVRRIQ